MLALAIAGGFFYFTTWRSNSHSTGLHPLNWLSQPAKVEITEASGGDSLDGEEQNNISVYHKNIPSVVNVTSRAMTFDFFYGLVPQEGQGSGFVIDKEGHILTNYHVVADARQVEVTLHNRKKYKATVVGTDVPHDLAVIQIKAPNLVPAVLGDSRNLQVGQKVYAIGNPFGLAGTMTRGIVSSIRPVREPNGAMIDEAIQTDAAINPGNSGGPLMNWHGEVIGINTMILSNANQSAGIGFAIPINTAKAVLNDLMTLGRVRRPALGQLCGAVAHPLLPFAGFQRECVCAQAFDDLGDGAGAAEVGAEARQSVIDDVRVRVIEAGQHRCAMQIDDPGARPAQSHHLAATGGHDQPTLDGQVVARRQPAAPKRADVALGEDQISGHAGPKVRK